MAVARSLNFRMTDCSINLNQFVANFICFSKLYSDKEVDLLHKWVDIGTSFVSKTFSGVVIGTSFS